MHDRNAWLACYARINCFSDVNIYNGLYIMRHYTSGWTRARPEPKSIFVQAAALVPSVQLVLADNTPVSPEDRHAVRDEFDRVVKSKFYRWLARHRTSDLKNLFDLSDHDLAILKVEGLYGLPKKNGKNLGELRGITVDHIVPISRGGNNDYLNLCLMWQRLNRFRETFEAFQLANKPTAPTIRTIVPPYDQNGEYKRIVLLSDRAKNVLKPERR